MRKEKFVTLAAAIASALLIVSGLVMYREGFAQQVPERHQAPDTENVTVADSVAIEQGLAELNRIIARYHDGSLQVKGEIRYYKNDSAGTSASEKTSFSFAVQDENSMYELDSVITITSQSIALIVDKKDESIAVVEKDESEAEVAPDHAPVPDALPEMREFIKDIRISNAGGYKELTLFFTDDAPSNILEYIILYDPQTYSIKKLTMKMVDSELSNGLPSDGESNAAISEEDELFIVDSSNNAIPTGMYAAVNMAIYEIVYTQEKTIQKGFINIRQFVEKQNGEYMPAGKYKNYSILH